VKQSERLGALHGRYRILPDDDLAVINEPVPLKKAYEVAMELENSGYKYYESMLAEVKEVTLKELLKFLLQEETRHHDLLQSTYTYLTDPANWFMKEEGGFPQG